VEPAEALTRSQIGPLFGTLALTTRETPQACMSQKKPSKMDWQKYDGCHHVAENSHALGKSSRTVLHLNEQTVEEAACGFVIQD